MNTPGILLMFHCEENTGYAIEKLEHTFREAALNAGYYNDSIHYSYLKLQQNKPNNHKISYWDESDKQDLASIISKHKIQTVLAFDLSFPSWIASTARHHGAKRIISYWGASMSSLNTGIKLALKKLEFKLKKSHAADLYIFESKAMQETAVFGRGIPAKRTTVINLGVDTDRFKPSTEPNFYTHDTFDIPREQKVVIYSGHMEERKGVATLIKCAMFLATEQNTSNFHFLICGNKPGEEATYLDMLGSSPENYNVTFGGYRSDLPDIMRSACIGVIASTGWDSFTMSSIEILSSGRPLLVSKLQGLAETTIPGETGDFFPPGDYKKLAERLYSLTEDEATYKSMCINARKRALTQFDQRQQIESISSRIIAGIDDPQN